jgi:hypothetical protein
VACHGSTLTQRGHACSSQAEDRILTGHDQGECPQPEGTSIASPVLPRAYCKRFVGVVMLQTPARCALSLRANLRRPAKCRRGRLERSPCITVDICRPVWIVSKLAGSPCSHGIHAREASARASPAARAAPALALAERLLAQPHRGGRHLEQLAGLHVADGLLECQQPRWRHDDLLIRLLRANV